MPREMAFRDEVGHACLQQIGRPGVHAGAYLVEPLRRIDRRDHISEPQSREHHLAEGSAIDHAIVLIQALERREWTPCIAELAVIVILDHPAAVCAGPVEQGDSTLERQRHTQWALMRWRDQRE